MSRFQATKKQNLPDQRKISRIQTKKAIFNGYIVPQSNICNHVATTFLSQSFDYGKLNSLVQDQRLTDAIEHLEKLGHTGDSAIFVLRCLQGGAA